MINNPIYLVIGLEAVIFLLSCALNKKWEDVGYAFAGSNALAIIIVIIQCIIVHLGRMIFNG